MRCDMTLNSRTELANTPGKALLQFQPLPGSDLLPFHVHVPATEASAFVVGETYAITIEKAPTA